MQGQMDMFALLCEDEPLDDLVRRIQHKGARLRIFAALTFPHFQQYADMWMREEYTGGVYSAFCSGGYRLKYEAGGAVWSADGEEHRFTWKQMANRARELIEEPDWLSREEEWIVNNLRGELPYPYPCVSYPEDAWQSAPPMYTGICTRCATLDRNQHGYCERCGRKVRALTPEEAERVNQHD